MASAVPLFNGLKHLPCPREAGGAKCVTPGCLFGHKADSQPSNAQPLESFDGAADEDGVAAGELNSPPKKRQKTTTADLAPVQTTAGDLGDAGRQHPLLSESLPDPSVERVNSSELYDPLSPPSVGNPRGVQPPKAVTPSSLNKTTIPPTAVPASRPLPKPATPLKSSASVASTPSSTGPSPSPRLASAHKQVPEPRPAKPSTSNSSSPSLLAKHSQTRPVGSPLAAGQTTSKEKAALPSPESKPSRKPESLNPRLLPSAPTTHGSRHKLLTLLHAEFTRLNTEVSSRSDKEPQLKSLILPAQELIWMALDKEQEIATQRAPIYSNIMRQEVMKYRRMKTDAWIVDRNQALEKKPVQENTGLGPPVVIKTGLTPEQEIEVLDRLITPITNLAPYGYVPAAPTEDEIAKAKEAVDMSKGWEQCDRCGGRFQVFPGRNITTGELASGGECTHHPGRLYFPERQRGGAMVPKKYRCCNEDVAESKGCATTRNHVFKTSDPKRLASLWNFAETPDNDSLHVRKAVAFDCEMGYSVHGMELVRLTATSWPDGAELVDVLVQPFGEIVDLNTRYSGVFPEDLARAVPWSRDWTPPPQQPGERKILQKVASPLAARDLLFSFISPDTVLIGHGLENDLNATRMIHPKIVDTILLYPHRRGLPIRTSLKVLMETCLNRRIQIDTGEGHDSAEDARAAGDLVRLKVQKEWALMQANGWRLVGTVLRNPDGGSSAPARRSEESVDGEEGGAMLVGELLEAGS